MMQNLTQLFPTNVVRCLANAGSGLTLKMNNELKNLLLNADGVKRSTLDEACERKKEIVLDS